MDQMAEDIIRFQRKPSELKGPLNPDIYPALNLLEIPAGDMMTPYENNIKENEISMVTSERNTRLKERLKYQTDYEKLVEKNEELKIQKELKFQKSMDEFYPGWRNTPFDFKTMKTLKKEKEDITRKVWNKEQNQKPLNKFRTQLYQQKRRALLKLESNVNDPLIGIPFIDNISDYSRVEMESIKKYIPIKREHIISRNPARQALIDARRKREFDSDSRRRAKTIIEEMREGQEEMQ